MIQSCFKNQCFQQEQLDTFNKWYINLHLNNLTVGLNLSKNSHLNESSNDFTKDSHARDAHASDTHTRDTFAGDKFEPSEEIGFGHKSSRFSSDNHKTPVILKDSCANRELFYKKIKNFGFCENNIFTCQPPIEEKEKVSKSDNYFVPYDHKHSKQVTKSPFKENSTEKSLTEREYTEAVVNEAVELKRSSDYELLKKYQQTEFNHLENNLLLRKDANEKVEEFPCKEYKLINQNMYSPTYLVSNQELENCPVLNRKTEIEIENSRNLSGRFENFQLSRSNKEFLESSEYKRPVSDPPLISENKRSINETNSFKQYSKPSEGVRFYETNNYVASQVTLQDPSILSNDQTSPTWKNKKHSVEDTMDNMKVDRKKLKTENNDGDRIWSPVFDNKIPLNYNLYFDNTKSSRWKNSISNLKEPLNITKVESRFKETSELESNGQYEVDERQRRHNAMHTFHAAMSQAFNLHCLRHPASFFYPPQNHLSHSSSNFDPAKMLAVAAAVVGSDAGKNSINVQSPTESQDGD